MSKTVLDACVRDLGIGLLAFWDVRRKLDAGTLVRIDIPGAKTEQLRIWAVFPTKERVPPRVRAFLDLLEMHLKRETPDAIRHW